ncbi:MAG TPA: translocation protein TolB [Pseudoneobacillus sp.]|nr:translocation protein TolB [Pseudoneobacillus sp.]
MMKRLLLIVILLFSILPSTTSAGQIEEEMKAAFVRNDNLWLKLSDTEVQVTKNETIRFPKWSFDGSWLAYLKGPKQDFFSSGELWIYNLKNNKHYKIKSNVDHNFQWASNDNTIGFQVNKDLYMVDTKSFSEGKDVRITSNIENFSWLPNGRGFLTSSKESTELDSDIILSKITFTEKNKQPIQKYFFTIPVKKDEYYVSTSVFKWSDDHKWISFLLVPTASLSADANILCILSSNGKVFRRIEEMLNYEDWFEWAPSKSLLGYISGIGREATSNKQFKVLNVTSMSKDLFTPIMYTDRDFTWQSNQEIYVSRSMESKWVDIKNRPLPSLYKINIKFNEQSKLTVPSNNEGDFQPQVFQNNIIWIRTDRQIANVLTAPTTSHIEKLWIKNINVPSPYYEKWNWDEVFSLYNRK